MLLSVYDGRKNLYAVDEFASLSLGTLLGALVIVTAWLLIWIYVRWANRHYDARVKSLRDAR